VHTKIRWNEDFDLLGNCEIDFSWRAQLEGFKVGFAPEAVMYVRFRDSIRALAAQWFEYGSHGPPLFKLFARHGMPRSPLGVAIKTWGWLLLNLPSVLRGGPARGRWIRVLALRSGRLRGSLRNRVTFL
jgi:GT2 family glycosyltransferase